MNEGAVAEPFCAFPARGPALFSMDAHPYSNATLDEIKVDRFCSIAKGARVIPGIIRFLLDFDGARYG